MGRWLQLAIGVLAAGATQFGILAGATTVAGEVNWVVILAGVIGAMGTTAAGLLKQLPREAWPEKPI